MGNDAFTRRNFLKGMALGAVSVGGTGMLLACQPENQPTAPSQGEHAGESGSGGFGGDPSFLTPPEPIAEEGDR